MTKLQWLAAFARNSYGAFLGCLATAHAHLTKPQYGKYNLLHLAQDDKQYVLGPLQDDEALLLFSVVRGMQMRAILEVGGLHGFSALNFIRALPRSKGGVVVTIDINKVRQVAENHLTVIKPAGSVLESDLRPLLADYDTGECFDMVFFDAHHYDGQMALLRMLQAAKLVNDDTILAFHDTDLHPRRFNLGREHITNDSGKSGFGRVDEHKMVRALAKEYQVFQLHVPHERLPSDIAFRHGLTLMQKKQL